MDTSVLIKFLINIFSVCLHVWVLLIIACTKSLQVHSFDALFFSQNIGDVVAVILRVITKYAPILILSNHTGIIEIDKTFPLATVTNGAEWYSNYVIILSALIFSIDRAVLAISLRSYTWFCNPVFKVCLVLMTWLLPLAWVLPMIGPCCQSQYFGGRIELVEMKMGNADSTYDAIDMLFETLFYVPALCMLNGFSLLMLFSQWKRLAKKRRIHGGDRELQNIPQLIGIRELCVDVGDLHHSSGRIHEDQKKAQKKRLERLDLELSFCMIGIIDQQIDFFAVMFYTLYWASYSGFIDVDGTGFVEAYSYFFEIGTIISPYMLLIFCTALREEFIHRVKKCFNCRASVVVETAIVLQRTET